jgi:prepilin-type N-terminal cleavage/methylation domain-containing protein
MIVAMRAGARGFGLIEILIVLAVVALGCALVYRYVGSTASTVQTLGEQRPSAGARLAADQATLTTIRSTLQAYYAANSRWPPDKAAALALLAGPPRFQCAGNDVDYDPASGQVRLLVEDPARC